MAVMLVQNTTNAAVMNVSATAPPRSTTTPLVADDLPDVSLGLIIPLSVISACMLVVGVCLAWYSWRCQRTGTSTKDQSSPSAFGDGSFRRNLEGELENWEEWRSSCRSTTPLRHNSLSRRADLQDFIPRRLTKISESPEDRLAKLQQQQQQHPGQMERAQVEREKEGENEVFASQDDSILAMVSRWPLPTVSGSIGTYEEMARDHSQSYPSLMLPAQPPFSPYHITWMSPYDVRTVQSDPNFYTSFRRNAQRSVSLRGEGSSYIQDHPRQTASSGSWKSPYHPNYNTPTGSDGDANALVNNVVINHTRSLPGPPSDASRVMPHDSRPVINPTCGSVPVLHNGYGPESSTDASGTLSCPSQVGSWHNNSLYRCSLEPRAYTTDQYYACTDPACPQSDPTYSCPSLHQSLQNCSTTNSSMYPVMGSSTNTSITMNQLTQSAQLAHQLGHTSANTSTCVMMDSAETTQSGIGALGTAVSVDALPEITHSDAIATKLQDVLNTNALNEDANHTEQRPSADVIEGNSASAMTEAADGTTNPFSSTAQSAFSGRNQSGDAQHFHKRPTGSDKSVKDWNEYLSSICERAMSSTGRSGASGGKDPMRDDVFSPHSRTDSSIQSVSLSPFFPSIGSVGTKERRMSASRASGGTGADLSQSHGSDNPAYDWDGSDMSARGTGAFNQQQQQQQQLTAAQSNAPVLCKDLYWV